MSTIGPLHYILYINTYAYVYRYTYTYIYIYIIAFSLVFLQNYWMYEWVGLGFMYLFLGSFSLLVFLAKIRCDGSVLFYMLLLIFNWYHLEACSFLRWEREAAKLDGESGEEVRALERRETVIMIHYIREEFIFSKSKKK